jgi:glyoxylase-like metal-dependent hydrolase (beta-lactamase superfamily II)
MKYDEAILHVVLGAGMKILEDVYVVGGGEYGIGLSGRLDCNMFLIDGGDDAVLIDAGVGDSTEKVIENIGKTSIELKKIRKLILTHAHLDHSGGAKDLKDRTGADLFISEEEADFVENGDEDAIGLTVAKGSGIYPNHLKLTPVSIDCRLKGGEEINAGRYTLKIIHTPGHSRGSVCILLQGHENRALFAGDTVFMRGLISLQNLPDSSLAEYAESMKKLKGLSVDALIPSHYGFTLNYGQVHVDLAIEACSSLAVPKMI